jgi:class 3 adenylate cyclase
MSNFMTDNKQIVFVDVVSYSLRKCVIQYNIINQFMKDIEIALNETIAECAATGLKKESVVKIPTGDGAAIVFPLQNEHSDSILPYFLVFIKKMLFTIYKNDVESGVLKCVEFEKNKYCDCHINSYCLRFGVSIGELVIYNDLNNHKNYAGTPINMASRVMGLAKKANQVVITEETYNFLNDIYPRLSDSKILKYYKDVEIKHDIYIDVYQYIDENIKSIGLDTSGLEVKFKEYKINEKKDNCKKSGFPKMT